LWALDLALAEVVTTTTLPPLGAIRLAWWRERLEELDAGASVAAEPRLQAVAEHLIPKGVTGAELSRLEFCWLALLGEFPWEDLQAEALATRGKILFGIGARLLGREAAEGEPLGVVWSMADGMLHCSDPKSRRFLAERAKLAIAEIPEGRVPHGLEPLAMLTAADAYDLLYHDRGWFHRVFTALHFSFFRTIPR